MTDYDLLVYRHLVPWQHGHELVIITHDIDLFLYFRDNIITNTRMTMKTTIMTAKVDTTTAKTFTLEELADAK